MPRYQQRVTETHKVDVIYTVEADSFEEAEEKVLTCDTVAEEKVPYSDRVVSRDEHSVPELIGVAKAPALTE